MRQQTQIMVLNDTDEGSNLALNLGLLLALLLLVGLPGTEGLVC